MAPPFSLSFPRQPGAPLTTNSGRPWPWPGFFSPLSPPVPSPRSQRQFKPAAEIAARLGSFSPNQNTVTAKANLDFGVGLRERPATSDRIAGFHFSNNNTTNPVGAQRWLAPFVLS